MQEKDAIVIGAWCSFRQGIQTQNLNIYNINKVIFRNVYFSHNWINKMFSKENKLPRTLFEAKRWQGPPHITKMKKYEFV